MKYGVKMDMVSRGLCNNGKLACILFGIGAGIWARRLRRNREVKTGTGHHHTHTTIEKYHTSMMLTAQLQYKGYNTFPRNRHSHFPCLNLALAVVQQLSSRASNGQLARLLHLGLEGDLVAVPPHLSHEGLARDDNASEANLDVLEGAESVKC